MVNNDNAMRFLKSYNKIDTALRVQGDMRRSISYTEAVRRAAKTNSFVKKYEDELVDYGRLRNAIVHSNNEEYIIAEPNIEVVEHYERIADLICSPPLAIDTVVNKNFKSLNHNVTVAYLMEFVYRSTFSSIPVYKNDMLIGVANASRLLRLLGKIVYEKKDIVDYINKTTVEESLRHMMEDNYYTIADENITLDKVLNFFTENRKLLLIVITKTGSLLEKPIGIISVGDIMKINQILDDYD